jgi:hypothetical protein
MTHLQLAEEQLLGVGQRQPRRQLQVCHVVQVQEEQLVRVQLRGAVTVAQEAVSGARIRDTLPRVVSWGVRLTKIPLPG